MEKIHQLSELSRQELYELIWSFPAAKIGVDFGISDVAVSVPEVPLKVDGAQGSVGN